MSLLESCLVNLLRIVTRRELIARGVRPNFAGCETVECIVANSSGLVSDASFSSCFLIGEARSHTQSSRGCCRSLFVI